MKEKLFLAAGIICWCYYLVCGFYGGFKISVLWIWAVAGLGFTALGLGWLGGIWLRCRFLCGPPPAWQFCCFWLFSSLCSFASLPVSPQRDRRIWTT